MVGLDPLRASRLTEAILPNARRLNPIKQKQMEERCAFLEEETPRIEAAIRHYEEQLGIFVSVAERHNGYSCWLKTNQRPARRKFSSLVHFSLFTFVECGKKEELNDLHSFGRRLKGLTQMDLRHSPICQYAIV